MKNKLIGRIAIIAIIFASALAFGYLNYCSIPVDMRMEATLQEVEAVSQGTSSMPDIKVIQLIIEKFILVFTSL